MTRGQRTGPLTSRVVQLWFCFTGGSYAVNIRMTRTLWTIEKNGITSYFCDRDFAYRMWTSTLFQYNI